MRELESVLPGDPLLAGPAGLGEKIASGKVRELYAVDASRMLLLATDRISAYDAILGSGIPGKGMILTQLSRFWFDHFTGTVAHHLVPDHDNALAEVLGPDQAVLAPRCLLVQRLQPLPVEAVVRGYLAGSGWSEYKKTGQLFGHSLPGGLTESARLPEPLFTPTTKAHAGHDEPLTPGQAAEVLGQERFTEVRDTAAALYQEGAKRAAAGGLLLADTKFEFGTDADGQLVLIDEALTPDSSRFWPAGDYEPGRPQHAFDKQFVRDYVRSLGWKGELPAPTLPPEVIAQTRQRYLEAFQRIVEA